MRIFFSFDGQQMFTIFKQENFFSFSFISLIRLYIPQRTFCIIIINLLLCLTQFLSFSNLCIPIYAVGTQTVIAGCLLLINHCNILPCLLSFLFASCTHAFANLCLCANSSKTKRRFFPNNQI